MCRMAAIKSKNPVTPAIVLRMMLAMQEGHDNSGFAMVMQDLGGAFANFKEFPLLSMACTHAGLELAEEYLEELGFTPKFDYQPDVNDRPGLDFQKMPVYVFRNYRYPESYVHRPWEEKKQLLAETCLELRKLLSEDGQGYVYSFWPDVLTLKEVGDPRDISAYFQMWEAGHWLQARVISAQCRQNTNYKIVRYAAHPFFLEGYTLMGNGEDTFYQKNKDFLNGLVSRLYWFRIRYPVLPVYAPLRGRSIGLAAGLLQARLTPLSFEETETASGCAGPATYPPVLPAPGDQWAEYGCLRAAG